jgi:hypothetical protein
MKVREVIALRSDDSCDVLDTPLRPITSEPPQTMNWEEPRAPLRPRHWVPTILILGLYNKLVKLLGSE